MLGISLGIGKGRARVMVTGERLGLILALGIR